jgi:hypothetical protein
MSKKPQQKHYKNPFFSTEKAIKQHIADFTSLTSPVKIGDFA